MRRHATSRQVRNALITIAALAVGIAGCGSDPASPADAAAEPTALVATSPPGADATVTPTPTSTAAAADVTVEIEIAGRDVAPPPGRTSVPLGARVRIEIAADQADTVHVHGYDVEAGVMPTAPAVFEFTADQPGLFEVETHDSGLLLTQLVVE